MNIILPFHVRAGHLAKVVGVLMHQPKIQTTFGGEGMRQDFAPTQPVSDKNNWYVTLDNPPTFAVWTEVTCPSEALLLKFQDREGNAWEWPFFRNSEYEEGQNLSPDESPLAHALGKRLCQFFGGVVSMSNTNTTLAGDVIFRVPVEEAALPPKLASQTADDRWNQFHNALFNLPPLSWKELEAEQGKGPRVAGPEIGLVERLALWESEDKNAHLDATLPPSSRGARPRF